MADIFKYIFILIIIVIINQYSSNNLDKLNNKEISDLGFDLIKEEDNIYRFNDFMVILLILWYAFKGKNKNLLFKLSSVLFFFRVIFMNITVLPQTKEQCPKNRLLPFTGGCRDLVYSGHTSLSVLILLMLISEGSLSSYIGFSYISLLIYIIIKSRSHYTLDIVLGGIAGFMVFNNRKSLNKLLS